MSSQPKPSAHDTWKAWFHEAEAAMIARGASLVDLRDPAIDDALNQLVQDRHQAEIDADPTLRLFLIDVVLLFASPEELRKLAALLRAKGGTLAINRAYELEEQADYRERFGHTKAEFEKAKELGLVEEE